jgi:mRNA-degrading endonuclease YafQ of YafQ-DinJ toxin-antitoxin module
MQLVWSAGFTRSVKRLRRQSPNLKGPIAEALMQLERDPFHSSLRTHKLKGDLSDRYACSVTYSDRIIFKFVTNPESEEEEIFLLAIGSHDEVY